MSAQKILVLTAAGAVALMGVLTVTVSSPDSTRGNATYVAGTTIQTTPPSTPSIESAGPKVKPTAFAGGDWPGMGAK